MIKRAGSARRRGNWHSAAVALSAVQRSGGAVRFAATLPPHFPSSPIINPRISLSRARSRLPQSDSPGSTSAAAAAVASLESLGSGSDSRVPIGGHRLRGAIDFPPGEARNRMDGGVFRGGDWRSSSYPSGAKGNQFLFDAKAALPQPQLFESTAVPAVGISGYYNCTGNNNLSVLNQARKTNNGTGDEKQLKLQMSLNNFHLEDADRLTCVGNPSAVSTGLRLSYEDDERNSSITSGSGSMSSLPSMIFVDKLMAEMDKENKEIDYHFRVQMEQLGKYVKEVRQRQMVSYLASLERGVGKKLREKELEVEAMNEKSKELNEQIRQVAMEVQSWQSAALRNQSVANSLKSKLMQVVAQSTLLTREGSGDSEAENTASSQTIDPAPGGFFQSSLLGSKSVGSGLGACRWCGVKEADVLVMPCRHLCLCADCERIADVCPVCRFPKSGSVEINMS